ncbi:MAG: hypothetical protein GXZ11_05570 [Tissierellia bacterium]|nr:hypothetical protein [Tissierellia bacterium]
MVQIFNPKPLTGRPTPSLEELNEKVDKGFVTMTMMLMQGGGEEEEPLMPPLP